MADPIGPAIEALRKKRGWKRSDLAKRVGCSYQAVYNLEREFRSGSEELLQRIATAFEVPLAEVMAKAPPPPPPRKAPTSTPSPSRPIAPPRETKPPSRHNESGQAKKSGVAA